MNIESSFINLGGKFITDAMVIQKKLEGIKAFIFDWDGVFNTGQKEANGSSNFSEVDSMGTNLLRYSFYHKNNLHPITAIISGEKNADAFYFCERECFNYSFFKVGNKIKALEFICEKENIKPHEITYFFDDVLDLSIAAVCGLRILIHRKSNPLFTNYCINNNLVDYLTGSEGGKYGIREATELLIGLNNNFDQVMLNRINSTQNYISYIESRKAIKTHFYTIKEKVIQEVNLTV